MSKESRLSDREKSDFTSSDGGVIISAAREAIRGFLNGGRLQIPESILNDGRFEKKSGCFASLKTNKKERALRGCVGFPEPVYKLSRALTESAIAAATQDPRFPPVKLDELDSLLVEISILSTPVLIKVNSQTDIPKEISIGEDGLILRWSFGSGLLLPQVAKENEWKAEEFLCNVSMKAGAPPDQWLLPGTIVFKFQSIIFEELAPNGAVHLIG